MKKYLFSLLLCVLSFTIVSCDDDDEIGDINTVTWLVTASDDNASVMLTYNRQNQIRVSSGKKISYETDGRGASCTVKCEDKYVLLNVKGYVNGKLKEEKEGTHWLQVSMDIK